MSPSARKTMDELDADLELLLFALGAALALAWLARGRVDDVRRELRAARQGRERAQQEAGDLRTQLDGALDELHRVAGERDAALGETAGEN